MKKFLLPILFFLLSLSSLHGGTVSARVDDPNAVAGNSVNLILEASGSNINFPDISRIGEYPVENRSTTIRSSFKVINGTTTQENIRQLVLTFTPTKEMIIEPFEIEVDGQKLRTEPIKLSLTPNTAPSLQSNEMFSLKMDANKKDIYVGETLLLSIYFTESRHADIMDFRGERPDLSQFVVKEIENEKTYRKGDNLVHEFRYLIAPTREGNVTIKPIFAKVAERTRVRDNFFGTFLDRPKWDQISSNSLTLRVKPLPSNADLVGDFKLAHELDTTSTKVNKPINLTVTISGEGNLEDFNKLAYDIPGVTVYSDDAKVESRLAGKQMISTYTKKFAFISDSSFTIPGRSFTLFNPKTNKTSELTISSYDITVEGSKPKSEPTIHSASVTDQPSHTQPEQTKEPARSESTLTNNPLLLAAAFAAGIILTLLVTVLPRMFGGRSAKDHRDPLHILYPHISEDAEAEKMVRDLYAKKGGDKSVVIDKAKLKALIEKYRES